MSVGQILLLFAALCFLVAAVGVGSIGPFALVPFGLFFLALAWLVGAAPIVRVP